MCKLEIPIVFASDENFLKQTFVSIYSVLDNRKEEYFLKFYILIPEECMEIRYDTNWSFKEYIIEYITIPSHYFKGINLEIQHITKPTYYRLLIPNLLIRYDQCIYLDGDTLCMGDIRELYGTEIGSNFIAASKGAILSFDPKLKEEELNIVDATNYINAGVLLMNLKLLRHENKVEEFLRCSEKKLSCQDQDVLNIICYGRIKLLPLRYNIYNIAFNMTEELLRQRYQLDEIKDAINNPMIIHYPTELAKPWNNLNCVKGKEWWKYAELIFDKETIRLIKQKAKKKLEKYNYIELFKKIVSFDKIVIFGFSDVGKTFGDQVDEKYPGKIVCFCDNSEGKIGKEYGGHRVLSMKSIKSIYPEALIIVTSQRFSNDIENQLIDNGFSDRQIAIYRKKTINYLLGMEYCYWNEVKQEINMDNISLKQCKVYEMYDCMSNN